MEDGPQVFQNFALRRTAEDNKNLFDAETVKTVHRNFYVDDLLKSVKTVENAKMLHEQLTLMLASGWFHLTKWINNNHEVLDVISQSEMASQLRNLSLDIEALPIETALGLEWNVEGDCFQFNISQKDKPHTEEVYSVWFPLFLIHWVLLHHLFFQPKLYYKHYARKDLDGMRLFLRKIYLSGKSGWLNCQS